jgi:hypothetical protein
MSEPTYGLGERRASAGLKPTLKTGQLSQRRRACENSVVPRGLSSFFPLSPALQCVRENLLSRGIHIMTGVHWSRCQSARLLRTGHGAGFQANKRVRL